MSDDRIDEIDAKLSELLPDDTDNISQETVTEQRKEEMIEMLKNVKERL